MITIVIVIINQTPQVDYIVAENEKLKAIWSINFHPLTRYQKQPRRSSIIFKRAKKNIISDWKLMKRRVVIEDKQRGIGFRIFKEIIIT